jgi:CRISPR-associated protein Csm4
MTQADWSQWQDWRFRLRLDAPLATPMQSDTLFGHICWQVALAEGQAGVSAFLEPFRQGEPPFILSDAFPAGLLPRPLFPPVSAPALTKEDYASRKRSEKAPFLKVADFQRICSDPGWADGSPQPDPWESSVTPHAAIDRRTGTTGGDDSGGAFYATTAQTLTGSEIDLYARARPVYDERLAHWLAAIGQSGFGRDKSVGLGRFTLVGQSPTDDLRGPENSAAVVVLSSYAPAAQDPTEGFWRLRLKRGRLGENAGQGNPFKKNLLQIEPGAVFLNPGGEPPRAWLGRLVSDIAPSMPEAVQCGLTLTRPCCRWPET